MKNKKLKIKKPRDYNLMRLWQSGMLRTKIIKNKKKEQKKYNWKKDIADYLNIKSSILILG